MTLRRLAVDVKFLKAISRIILSFRAQTAKSVHGTLSGSASSSMAGGDLTNSNSFIQLLSVAQI
jgi:hypothetical protein